MFCRKSALGLLLAATFLLFNVASSARSVLNLEKVTDNVYAIVGPLTNRAKENLGNNATFGFVVTSEGVVLIDSGGTYKGAREIHRLIKTVTNKPVRLVINTGGQDHRWLGNGYFKEQGARIVASEAAVKDQKARLQDQFIRLGSLVGDEVLMGTNEVYADELVQVTKTFQYGDTRFVFHHPGQAHTPGDSFVWLPELRVMFTGDIVYTERMLSISDVSHSANWIRAFETMAAYKPLHVVPGHGSATTLAKARKDTYEYLVFLRQLVQKYIKQGGTEGGVGRLDQSRFKYLRNYENLKGRNIQRVFQEMEWE